MAEYSANSVQVVNPGESIVFTEAPVPCRRGLVRHRDDSGNFLLSGAAPINYNRCRCCQDNSVNYLVDFAANIAIADGGAVEPISVAIAVDGATIPTSTMTVTPAAVGDFFSISRAINVEIWKGCCETVTVRNTSAQPIQVQNANIIFSRNDLYYSR